MAHKVHPKSYRIKETNDWDSRGFYQKKSTNFLKEDYEIRGFLGKRLERMGVEKIEIERFPRKVNIIILSSRPGLIIGRGGEEIIKLKKDMFRMMNKKFDKKVAEEEVNIEIKEVRNPWLSAKLSADWAGQQLVRRVPYKRVLKQIVEKINTNKEVLGVRVEFAGRLDGVEIARREWSQKGRLPRQTIRADIDYASEMARCSYGAIGIKVWIYKGEKFN